MTTRSRETESGCSIEETHSFWPDGVQVFSKRWMPNSTKSPRALVIALHGFAEHVGRYDHVWPIFAARDIEILAYDQRGFGRSGATHGNTTLNQSVLDLKHTISQERERLDARNLKDVALFVYAHSMGATIVLALFTSPDKSETTTILERNKIGGIICAAPWILRTKPPNNIVLGLAPWLLWLAPNIPFYKTINPDGLTSDNGMKASYAADPLHDGNVYLKTVIEPLIAGYGLLNDKYKYWPKDLPLLITHGENDPSTSSDASRMFLSKIGSIDKELKLWPDMLHEGHNERPEIRDPFLEYSIRWIESRTGNRS